MKKEKTKTRTKTKTKTTTKTNAKTKTKSPKIAVGKKAPAFRMECTDGRVVASASLKGVRYVLYFYPKDMTSGCTVEAHEFSELAKKFTAKGAVVFGVSPDSIESHHKFIKKETLSLPLLADIGHKVADAYGVWVEKSMYGKKYMGIARTTFVVGVDGKFEAIYRDVKPEGHAVCVLKDIK